MRPGCAVLVLLMLAACAGEPAEMDLLRPVEIERTGRPNDALSCPAGACEGADLISPTFPAPVERQLAAWHEHIGEVERAEIVASDGQRGLIAAQDRTRWLGFRDSIWIEVVPVDEGSSFFAYSRSNLGYYDLGTNKTRLQRWSEGIGLTLGVE